VTEERKSAVESRARILAAGPTPPPLNGMSVATQFLLRSRAAREYGIRLVDISDRRGLGNVGRFDVGNVWLALRHGLAFMAALFGSWPSVVYVPVAQNRLGFLRDSLFLVPARVLGRSVVIHVHGGHFGRFYAGSGPLTRGLIRFAIGRASVVVVLGECLASMAEGIVPASRVRVVPNGIDDFMPSLPPAPRPTRPVVQWLSKMDSEKGYLDVLSAARRVVRHHPDVLFRFAGEWLGEREEREARAYVAEHGLDENVEFLGPVQAPAKYALLAGSAMFVLPTRYRYEGQPYSIIEAMCAGLPVVTSRVGCIAETVEEDVTGFFVEPGDTDELASRIERLLEDPGLGERMGRAGRARFLERFTFERWDAQMYDVFSQAQFLVSPTQEATEEKASIA
jgi:glycosyltransferase involved in cell wall biosynthesis